MRKKILDKCRWMFLIVIIEVFVRVPYVEALAPESITSDEVITIQVSGGIEGVASPFIVPGESLITLITDMVNFEEEGTNIVFHRPTGKLFVRNTPENINRVESILEELRTYVADEILIEARIIEVTSFDGTDLGVEIRDLGYTVDVGNHHGTFGVNGNAGGGSDVTNFGAGVWTDDFPLTAADEFSILGFINTSNLDIDVLVHALAQKVDLNTLASPRISCFNNQRANIQIIRTQSYVSDIDTTTQTVGDTLVSVPDPVVSEADSGIVLDITPTISTDRKSIILEFHPVVIDLILVPGTIPLGTTGEVGNIFFPDFVTRSVDTTVLIPDGGTVIIGGLMTREEREDVRKIPFFGDIPLLGNLFKTTTKSEQRKNLLFFITAKIKDNDRAF